MNEQELKELFWNLYNSCYIVKYDDYPESDFLYYDKNFTRTIKMSEILEREIVYPSEVVGKCLFELDWKNKYLWIDRDEIWSVFESELSHNYQEINVLIEVWLKEHDKLEVLTPFFISLKSNF